MSGPLCNSIGQTVDRRCLVVGGPTQCDSKFPEGEVVTLSRVPPYPKITYGLVVPFVGSLVGRPGQGTFFYYLFSDGFPLHCRGDPAENKPTNKMARGSRSHPTVQVSGPVSTVGVAILS